MGLLDRLDDIDWASIYHSHGTSEEFPHYLRELAKNDSESWDEAVNYIREYSNHQDSIYDVTPYVVPFLVELLQAMPLSKTPELLNILAGYAWSLENSYRPGWLEQMQKNVANGSISEAWLSAHVKSMEDTRAGLEANLDLFLPYLDHEDPEVRAPAAELLYQFTKFPKINEAIELRRQKESDSYVKEVLQYGFQL